MRGPITVPQFLEREHMSKPVVVTVSNGRIVYDYTKGNKERKVAGDVVSMMDKHLTDRLEDGYAMMSMEDFDNE